MTNDKSTTNYLKTRHRIIGNHYQKLEKELDRLRKAATEANERLATARDDHLILHGSLQEIRKAFEQAGEVPPPWPGDSPQSH